MWGWICGFGHIRPSHLCYKEIPMKNIIILLSFMPCLLWAAMADDLYIEGAYMRANIPARSTTAAYMSLENKGETALVITGVKTPVADSAMIHNTVMEDHMMHMTGIKSLEIPANSKVELAPGGMHLMLMDLHDDLTVGKNARITFMFKDGSKKTATIPIESIK
jgi:hypothetical protein